MAYRRNDQRRGSDRERHFRPQDSPPQDAYRARRSGGLGWTRRGDVLDRTSQGQAPRNVGGRYDREGEAQYEEGLHNFEEQEGGFDDEIDFRAAAQRWELDDGGVQFGGSRRAGASGPFAGRGPRGYQRADERIREDVCDCMTEASDVDATDIEVTVTDGVVTLRGTATSRLAKRRAEDIAATVRGVRDVQNQLRLHDPGAEAEGC